MAGAASFLSNLDPASEVLSDGTIRLADGSVIIPPRDVQQELLSQPVVATRAKFGLPADRPVVAPPTQQDFLDLLEFAPGPVGVGAGLETLRRDEDRSAVDFAMAGINFLPGGKILRKILASGKKARRGEIVEDIIMEGDEITSTRRIEAAEDIVLGGADELPTIPDRQVVIDILTDDGLSPQKAEKVADALLQLSRANFTSATTEALEALERGANPDDVVEIINRRLGKLQ